jgi:hypothetical protein
MSAQIDDGGAAFPLYLPQEEGDIRLGMTLRDWFAGQALGDIASYSMRDGWARSGPEWRDAAALEC